MRGSSGHKVVNIRNSKSRKQQELTVRFGDKPWDLAGMVSDNPHDNWLRYQAQSVLGGPLPTLEQAQELFERIDPDTRQPRAIAEVTDGFLAKLRSLLN